MREIVNKEAIFHHRDTEDTEVFLLSFVRHPGGTSLTPCSFPDTSPGVHSVFLFSFSAFGDHMVKDNKNMQM